MSYVIASWIASVLTIWLMLSALLVGLGPFGLLFWFVARKVLEDR